VRSDGRNAHTNAKPESNLSHRQATNGNATIVAQAAPAENRKTG